MVKSSPNRSLIQNLDDLPFPSWKHIDPRWYFDPVKRYPFLTLISGRGCPYKCSFCVLPQTMMGQRYRFRSPTNVVDEIEYDLKLFPFLKGIMFEDDTLTADRNRCREICLEILHRGLDIWWGCNTRADVLDQDLLTLMHRAGCDLFVVGYESGSQQILNKIRKGLKLEVAREFTRLAKKAGIYIHGCFIFGLPGETTETIMETLRFMKELQLDTVQIYAATPYPGTKFYHWAESQGYLIVRRWNKYVSESGEQTCIISYPHLKCEEIISWVNQAYRDFYFNPRTMLSMIFRVRGWSDLKRIMKGFFNFLGYWQTYGRGTIEK